MAKQEPDKFFTGVTAGTDNGYLDLFHNVVRNPKSKKKNPASVEPAGRKKGSGLTLAELETLASAGLTVLLAFAHAGIASEESLGFKSGTKIGVGLEKGASDAVTTGTGLAVRAASGDGHADVELTERVGGDQRLQEVHTLRFNHEIVFQGATIDGHFARTGGEADASDSGFAATSSDEFFSHNFKWNKSVELRAFLIDYSATFSAAGCCAACGWAEPL